MTVFDCVLKIFLANIKVSIKDYFFPNNLTKTVARFIKKEFNNLDIQYISNINKNRHVIVGLRNVNDKEIGSLIESLQMRFGTFFDEIQLTKF